MEAGWELDSFQKNDMIIDVAYKFYISEVQKKIPENDLIDIQLELYSKDEGKGVKLFRMIVALGDTKNKILQVGDGVVKMNRMDASLVSNVMKEALSVNTLPQFICPSYPEKYPDLDMQEFLFQKPILSKFYAIKKGIKSEIFSFSGDGKTRICKLNDKKEMEEFYTYNF